MLTNTGDLLTIDVTDRQTTTTDISHVLDTFVGGRGACVRLAHERIPYNADPFGPENRLFFASGPLQVSQMSYTGRMNCTGISPLTDGLLSTNAGGYLSRNFADTGFAAVEITGKSSSPLGIHVSDSGIDFHEVPELTETRTSELLATLEDQHEINPDEVISIGPAGENCVRFACLMTSESRAFGRGGLGAVLGSKGVKYLAFHGNSHPEIEIPAVQSKIHSDAATSDHIMKRQGTTSVTTLSNEMGGFPTRFWEQGSFEAAEDIGGPAVEEKKYKKGTCSNCAFACKLPTRDEATGIETEGPEYETVFSFGSNPMIDDVVDVMKSNDLCDELGMDTISAGNTITGYLQAHDEFGNAELVHQLIEDIAFREGDGDLLAEGLARCHGELGVHDWTVKGMEPAAHDGRVLNGQGLGYATSNRGADHMYSCMYSFEYPLVDSSHPDAVDPDGVEGKANLLARKENLMAVNDSGIICKFSRYHIDKERYEALFNVDFEVLLNIGEKIVGLERLFNNERGFDVSDDSLPFELDGLEQERKRYYEERRWRSDGTVPNAEAEYLLDYSLN
jgi:aldehyde:ferredoxin oxidoreductase